MRSFRENVLRAALVGGAMAASVAIAALDLGLWPSLALIALVLGVAGWLAKRTWVLALPFVAAAGFLLQFLIFEGEPGGDMTWALWILMAIAVAIVGAAFLAGGIAVRHARDAADGGPRGHGRPIPS